MYNTDFSEQIAKSRRHLFGNGGSPPSVEDCALYSLPASLRVVPCRRESNGEWVPEETPSHQETTQS